MAAKKTTINDYKDRMSAPMGGREIDPRTKKPIKKGGVSKATKKKR